MIDIHTHILPGMDDGAADIYDSIEMAALAYENGTKVIVATPHCNIPGEYNNYFGKEYCRVFRKTKEIIQREQRALRFWRNGSLYDRRSSAASDGGPDISD